MLASVQHHAIKLFHTKNKIDAAQLQDLKPFGLYIKDVRITTACLLSLQSWLPARALVQKAIDGRYEVDASGQIIKLPVAGCPWKEHLNQLEEELKLGDAIKFCIYEVSWHENLVRSCFIERALQPTLISVIKISVGGCE